MCGKSETVSWSRTVTTEQPHPTLAHGGLNTPLSLSGLEKPPSSRTHQPGAPDGRPQEPSLRADFQMAFLTPLSVLCSEGPFSGCICSLVLDTEPWEEEGGSGWEGGWWFGHQERKGEGTRGGGWAHGDEHSLAGCFSLVPVSLSPQLRASSSVLDP